MTAPINNEVNLKKKITLLCGDANALADELLALAHTAKELEAARILAERAQQLALSMIAPKVWGYLFHADERGHRDVVL
jgi:hypothetical protein